MTYMPNEPEAFGEQVEKILRRNYPDSQIELVEAMHLTLNGKHLGLENLYRLVMCNRKNGVEIVENYLDRMMEGDEFSNVKLPLSVAKPKIMPRIQHVSIFEHLDVNSVAHVPFVNDTVIVFVIDMQDKTVSITTEQMIRWGIQLDDMEQIAKENLAVYQREFEVQFVNSKEGGHAAIISVQDGYDASRILLYNLHKRLSLDLSGDFYVATPVRDCFIALSLGPPEFLERVKKRTTLDHGRLPYPITPEFFVVTRDGVAGTKERETE